MALKLFPISIPIFSSRSPNLNPSPPPSYRAVTEIRYSRWDNSTGDPPPLPDGSSGTGSVQPRLSIRGRRSKYFKPRPPPETHPAFRAAARFTKLPPKQPPSVDRRADVRVGEGGVSYVIDGAPFEFKYSYTETPTVKPLRFREAPYSPFGPDETGRPWTGRKRLPGSKKKLPKFDSFRLPPPDKKGVKPIQAPGPYLPGTGPRYARTREEILGEPLSPIEVRDLVNACHKTRRQLNMGRDGFTHNMLENIHALWKRKRVCKIKCKGVCTVDMDSVCQQLEEKTGGKIIYRKGGVVYLFRGRNYNVTTRPRFPLMLWKPASPMYPRLIQKAPAGLTIDEASDMRKRGLKLTPIRKLAKNGLYSNLVHQVREAFEVCELVKIDCQGLNASDFRKIGAKLRDLVPCVLISFERESILIWRGKEWKSSLKLPLSNSEEAMQTNADSTATYPHFVEDPETGMLSIKDSSLSTYDINVSTISSGEQEKDQSVIEGQQNIDMDATSTVNANELESPPANGYNSASSGIEGIGNMNITEAMLETAEHVEEAAATLSEECDETRAPSVGITELPQDVTETMSGSTELEKLQGPYLDGVLSLWKQAIESGSALVLVDENLDADIVYQSSVAFSHSAPPGPVFRFRPIKVHVEVGAEEESPRPEAKEPAPVPESRGKEAKSRAKHPKHIRMKGFEVPQSQRLLGVDELAKLLA